MMMHHTSSTVLRYSLLFAAMAMLLACGEDADFDGTLPAEPGASARDSAPDGLFADFLDGKFDAAGHPIGAEVFQAESDDCRTEGSLEAEGVVNALGEPSLLCGATSKPLGQGRFTLSARVLVHTWDNDADEVVTVIVRDQNGNELGDKTVETAEFEQPLLFRNVAVTFTSYRDEPVTFEVLASGKAAARLDYVEIFRATRQLVIEPVSGVIAPDATLRIEVVDPPTDYTLDVSCGDIDLSETLDAMLASGLATRQTTDFREIIEVAGVDLLANCPLPTRFMVTIVASGGWSVETSRVSWYADVPPCTFDGPQDGVGVLLTGFEPFPADSRRDNSSEKAVTGLDVGNLPNVKLMKMVLPVEYDTAPALLADAIRRCEPDVVIGFGQGRSAVDIETTAYNTKDTASISGGIPDNRGIVYSGTPIADAGAEELQTALPVGDILAGLEDKNIPAGPSDDPGRYVCNNLFYSIMTAVEGTGAIGGFVHLPRIPDVDDDAQKRLETTLEVVVNAAVNELGRTDG